MILEEKIRKLPPEKREVIERLVDILLEGIKPGRKLSLNWAGKAEKLGRDGVYWQHKVLEWWSQDAS
ncbi:MAG: hypothetical protein J7L52_09070 [Thermotogae bacterium]|nr:hypothetical protein [Thermotogota bacterium]